MVRFGIICCILLLAAFDGACAETRLERGGYPTLPPLQ